MMYDSEMGGLVAFLVFYFIFVGLILLASLASYLLRGFGIWRISKGLGIRGGVLGFVPVATLYQHGVLAGDEILVLGRRVRSPGLWMVLVPIFSQVVTWGAYFIFIVGLMAQTVTLSYMDDQFPTGLFITMFVGIMLFFMVVIVTVTIQMILKALVNLRIFSYYMAPDRALVHTLLCAFVPLYESIYMFILGKRTPINPPMVPAHRAIGGGGPAPTYYYTQQQPYAPPKAPSPYAPQQTPPPYAPPQSPSPYAQPETPKLPETEPKPETDTKPEEPMN